MTFLSLNLF